MDKGEVAGGEEEKLAFIALIPPTNIESKITEKRQGFHGVRRAGTQISLQSDVTAPMLCACPSLALTHSAYVFDESSEAQGRVK
jgi:hypothetical protein